MVLDFDTVYGQHVSYARKVLQRFGVGDVDLDDALQDAFVTIHRLLGNFEGRAKVETWIYAICWRVAANCRRRVRFERASVLAEPGIEAERGDLPPSEQVYASLGSLDASDRDLLVLHEVGDMSLLALSELTGRSRDVIRRRIEQARRTLKQVVAGAGEPTIPFTRELVDEEAVERFARHADDREYLCAEYAFSRFGHMVLTRWRGVNDARALSICAKVTMAAAADAPEGFTYLSVVDPTAQPPDEDARRLTAWLMGEVAHRMNAIAFAVITAEHRDLVPQTMNASAFLSGSTINIRHFGDATAAMSWLAQHTPGASVPALVEHCEDLGRRMLGRAPGAEGG